jgi:hypothetical protein
VASGHVHVDVDRFNRINVNRAAIQSEVWRAPPLSWSANLSSASGAGCRPRPMPSGVHLRRAECHDAWVPVRRSLVPVFRPPPVQWTRPRQPVARPPVVIERQPPPEAASRSALDSIRGGRVRHCARRCGEWNCHQGDACRMFDIFDIYLLEALINGVLLGGVLALLALGLNLIFGVIDVVWICYAG